VALLRAALAEWRPRGLLISAGHVEHGIRGAESEADARFVAALCGSLSVPFRLCRVDVPAAAAATGESTEMAARRLRYDALFRLARELGADAVATGHTLDDQLETLFLRLARGTGPSGLACISPDSPGRDAPAARSPRLLRPLLSRRHAELADYLRSLRQPWREDATNASQEYLRNRVRTTLVPAFEAAFGADGIRNAARSVALLAEEENDWLRPLVRNALSAAASAGGLSAAVLRTLPRPLARRVLLEWLHFHEGLSPERQSRSLLDALLDFAVAPDRGERDIALSETLRLRRSYDALTLVRASGRNAGSAPVFSLAVVPGTGPVREPRRSPLEPPFHASLAADRVGDRPLTVRAPRPGDRFRPLGGPGCRLVSDILTDLKVPRSRRSAVPLVCCGDEIAWIPGYAVAAGYAVAPSAPALHLTLEIDFSSMA